MQITESKTSFQINALEIHGGNTNAIEIQIKLLKTGLEFKTH